jgi:hypothetical protein
MQVISFTGNLSSAYTFSGVVKVKVEGLQPGGSLKVLEQLSDASDYEQAIDKDNNDLAVSWPQTSALFELMGSYKFVRSSGNIKAGYES